MGQKLKKNLSNDHLNGGGGGGGAADPKLSNGSGLANCSERIRFLSGASFDRESFLFLVSFGGGGGAIEFSTFSVLFGGGGGGILSSSGLNTMGFGGGGGGASLSTFFGGGGGGRSLFFTFFTFFAAGTYSSAFGAADEGPEARVDEVMPLV